MYISHGRDVGLLQEWKYGAPFYDIKECRDEQMDEKCRIERQLCTYVEMLQKHL